jgi:hypothetical protein
VVEFGRARAVDGVCALTVVLLLHHYQFVPNAVSGLSE